MQSEFMERQCSDVIPTWSQVLKHVGIQAKQGSAIYGAHSYIYISASMLWVTSGSRVMVG